MQEGVFLPLPRNLFSCRKILSEGGSKKCTKSSLTELLKAFEENRVKSIESHGQLVEKLTYASKFEKKLHLKSQDHEKAQIINKAFFNTLKSLSEEDQNAVKKVVVKYVDYIGVRKENIMKILKGSKETSEIFQREDGKEALEKFLDYISADMKLLIDEKISESNDLRVKDHQSPIDENVVVITTTSSGGAHLSIASVLNDLLSEKQIPHVVVNESELIPEDNLKRFVGIPRKEVYNKVSQQSQRMTYGKNLKKLDDYLNGFVPDQYMNQFRSSIGNSTLLVRDLSRRKY